MDLMQAIDLYHSLSLSLSFSLTHTHLQSSIYVIMLAIWALKAQTMKGQVKAGNNEKKKHATLKEQTIVQSNKFNILQMCLCIFW